jgi:hypothetical protein
MPYNPLGGLNRRATTASGAHKQVDVTLSAILAAVVHDKTLVGDYRDIWNEVAIMG